jgi:hypothetical protein
MTLWRRVRAGLAPVPFGTFEPWLAGDRQKTSSVAKARNTNKKGPFEVSLS